MTWLSQIQGIQGTMQQAAAEAARAVAAEQANA